MEIEIKAKCENFTEVIKKLKELGAKLIKKQHQIDIYYNHPNKDLRKLNEYIRLRKANHAKEVVFGYHINLADGVNREIEVKVDDWQSFEKILELSGFKKLGIIDKKREKYEFEAFKITLDIVKDIGNFVEIETDGEESEQETKKQVCLELLEKLGIPKENLTNVWLCDIATGKINFEGGLKNDIKRK